MTIDFVKASPGGNTTILVESSVEKQKRAQVANWLMSPEVLCAEQVGYLVNPPTGADARLEMMGGELCINALRSVSALLFQRDATKKKCVLSSSGADNLISCINTTDAMGGIYSSLQLDMKMNIEHLKEGCDLVHLGGISHIVCRQERRPSHDEVSHLFTSLSSEFERKLVDLAAYGVIPFIVQSDLIESFPVVYVRATNSTVFETGCGSGSIAIALSQKKKDIEKFSILQPSGVPYDVSISPFDDGVSIELGSAVNIVAEGRSYLSLL